MKEEPQQHESNFKYNIKEEITDILVDFCKNTSLHGYQYLVSPRKLVVKICWIISVFTVSCISIALFIKNTNAFLESGIVTTIETSAGSLDVIIVISTYVMLLEHAFFISGKMRTTYSSNLNFCKNLFTKKQSMDLIHGSLGCQPITLPLCHSDYFIKC